MKSFNGDVDRFKAVAVKQVIVYMMNNHCCSNLIAENECDATIAMVVCERCVSWKWRENYRNNKEILLADGGSASFGSSRHYGFVTNTFYSSASVLHEM